MNFVAGIVLGLLLSVPEPADIQRAARVVLEDDRYQTAHPEVVRQPSSRPQARRRESTRRRTAERTPEVRRTRTERPRTRTRNRVEDTSSTDGALGTALGWLLLSTIVLVITVRLIARLRGGGVARRTRQPVKSTPKPIHLTKALTAAQKFAAAGAWNDAVHALLLDTLDELRSHIPSAVARSYTSREILQRAPVSDAAREALGLLVASVEQTAFGHATADASDYTRCEQAWRAFAARVTAA